MRKVVFLVTGLAFPIGFYNSRGGSVLLPGLQASLGGRGNG